MIVIDSEPVVDLANLNHHVIVRVAYSIQPGRGLGARKDD